MKHTNITFKNFALSEELLKSINKKGFEEPTTIQSMVIPVMLRNDTNIIAQAQTGTGKTAAFGLPLLELISADTNTVQALILTPTRELAIQVAEEINSFKIDKNIKVAPIYGGQSIDQQFRRLKNGIHIIVGTPGRVLDHLKRKTLKLHNIRYLILDEADEMLNMGFIEDIEAIMEQTNSEKITSLFSATIPAKIKTIARKYMPGYEFIKAKKEQLTTDLTQQIYFEVKDSDKFEALCRIIDIENNFYGLIFCRTKKDTDSITSHLSNRGYDVEAIHGDIAQRQREKTIENFRKHRINILVATDVAARGIDVYNISHVINYSLPQDPESYIHRIGRTGRAGNKGTAITFITPNEYRRLMFIQRTAKTDIKKSKVPKVDDIIRVKQQKIYDELHDSLKEEIDTNYYSLADKLLENNNPHKTLAAMLKYCFDKELNYKNYGAIKEYENPKNQLDLQGKTRLFIALGKKDKFNPKKLIALVTGKINIKQKQISDIQIFDKFSFLTVPFDVAEKIISGFQNHKGKPLFAHAKKKK